MPDHPAHYVKLAEKAREAANMHSVSAVLAWDQETYMPAGGADARAGQLSLVARLHHEMCTAKELGELITACEADDRLTEGDTCESANIREMRRDYDKKTKLPAKLVSELTEATSRAQHAWKSARADSNFAAFRPFLDKVLELSREKARCLSDGSGELYDALIDVYEPGVKASEIEEVFTPLRKQISDLVRTIADNGKPPSTEILERPVAPAKQEAFGKFVAESCGFSFERGRLDITTHPFCEGVGPGDTRMTTRYREASWTDSLYGIMHEMGHGLYEQGLPLGESHGQGHVESQFGLPCGEAVSLGIHESQSRLWENAVGRSQAFWTWALPHAQKHLGQVMGDQTPESITRAVNTADPSLIRVEADEGTYNLHIMIRFELERALLSGDLSTADLPDAWNTAYKESLGLDVPNDREGCLQDVHWSFGLIGYFPTYTLGNLYAAQFWEKVREENPDLDDQIAKGNFAPLLSWFRSRIHIHGRRYTPSQLCERATGKPLSAEPLVRQLKQKLYPVYGIKQ
ncbi:MAG: carboxypeptidase M32 [Phycisphaerales bacterium]|nr:carboxypeptidase M32 [Phycisphaerales bacterium]MCB9835146.1 carboxypeptidase M32 [Phycisphaera sp.]